MVCLSCWWFLARNHVRVHNEELWLWENNQTLRRVLCVQCVNPWPTCNSSCTSMFTMGYTYLLAWRFLALKILWTDGIIIWMGLLLAASIKWVCAPSMHSLLWWMLQGIRWPQINQNIWKTNHTWIIHSWKHNARWGFCSNKSYFGLYQLYLDLSLGNLLCRMLNNQQPELRTKPENWGQDTPCTWHQVGSLSKQSHTKYSFKLGEGRLLQWEVRSRVFSFGCLQPAHQIRS